MLHCARISFPRSQRIARLAKEEEERRKGQEQQQKSLKDQEKQAAKREKQRALNQQVEDPVSTGRSLKTSSAHNGDFAEPCSQAFEALIPLFRRVSGVKPISQQVGGDSS